MSIVDFSQIDFEDDLIKTKFKIYNIGWQKSIRLLR